MTLVSAWALLPEDLRALGYQRDPRHLFSRLQRVESWALGRPALARHAREVLTGRVDFDLPNVVARTVSGDGSTKVLLQLADGERIEAVHMPRAVRRPRVTLCISSQVGCAMGCSFCATARMGLRRNLAAHEIVGQVLTVMRDLGPPNATTLNIVFMGMGEPLHNLDAVTRALDVLCDEAGLGVPPSRITVSTVGLASAIDRLARARYRPTLAISINEVADDARRKLMPINRRWSLAELRSALERWPKRPHEKLTFEYVVLGGVNHTDEHADRLAAFIGDFRHNLNLIPFNPWNGSPYRAPVDGELRRFANRLYDAGCLVTVRKTRGRDTQGACGTLATAAPI